MPLLTNMVLSIIVIAVFWAIISYGAIGILQLVHFVCPDPNKSTGKLFYRNFNLLVLLGVVFLVMGAAVVSLVK